MITTFVNLVSAKQVTEKSAILIRFVGGLSPKCCSCEYVNIQKHSVCKSGLQHPGDIYEKSGEKVTSFHRVRSSSVKPAEWI